MPVDAKTLLAVDYYSGSLVRRVACKVCGQVLYDHESGDSGHPDVLYAAIASHLELAHSYSVEARRCIDPGCCPEERYGEDARP